MTTTIQNNGNQLIACFDGRLDTAAAIPAAEAVKPLLEAEGKEIILDCSKLEYISSSGLRIFLSIRKEAAAHGSKVIVRSISADIRQVFVMTGFISLFEIQ
ncbi:MAG: STAS domain-containing protein [Paludibacteraceae bacterium]|nr:STAS domain-containing protein [Paludibacteraceae bacterium]MBQ8704972.1 STAS domain-containing protein [Paludibacteraceae bacterium]MBQ9297005.1 STAS domain-containing protein [Paludibacteraceae bacterium]